MVDECGEEVWVIYNWEGWVVVIIICIVEIIFIYSFLLCCIIVMESNDGMDQFIIFIYNEDGQLVS